MARHAFQQVLLPLRAGALGPHVRAQMGPWSYQVRSNSAKSSNAAFLATSSAAWCPISTRDPPLVDADRPQWACQRWTTDLSGPRCPGQSQDERMLARLVAC